MRSLIRDRSGGILEVVGPDAIVQVIHEAVRDFLVGELSLSILGLIAQEDFPQDGHERLMQACTAYLNIAELDWIRSESLGEPTFRTRAGLMAAKERYEFQKTHICHDDTDITLMHPFTAYAASHWLYHARQSNTADHSQKYLQQWAREKGFERWLILAESVSTVDPGIDWASGCATPEEAMFRLLRHENDNSSN